MFVLEFKGFKQLNAERSVGVFITDSGEMQPQVVFFQWALQLRAPTELELTAPCLEPECEEHYACASEAGCVQFVVLHVYDSCDGCCFSGISWRALIAINVLFFEDNVREWV